ncbi:MAG: glycosyltransferase family 39 protein [Saprospiraceae bacterium]|nr:glycosyltransferase family 39 protein [Saprospiraceae bacterium]MDW8484345.1 glycosyltransferase family 39 protein [Saprospiraceae bacterium]
MSKTRKKIAKPTAQSARSLQDQQRNAKTLESTQTHKWEQFVSAQKVWFSLAIFLLSLALRYLYFHEVRQSPASTLHTWKNSDMEFYDAVAKRLASGDWLLDTAMQPYHVWHDELARTTFNRFPETAKPYYERYREPDSLGGGIDTLAACKAFISEKMGGKTFYQDPLYAYLIALTYKALGTTDPHWVYAWQMLLGALTNVLVFWLGGLLFGSLAGLLGALLIMLSGPIMVYEATLLRSTLTAFLTVLALYLYVRTLKQPTLGRAIGVGMVAGFSMLNQSYFLLFWLPAFGWLAWQLRRSQQAWWKVTGAAVFAWLLMLSPLFCRNALVGAPVTAFTGAGSIIYVSYNGPTAHPLEPNFWDVNTTVDLFHKCEGSLLKAIVVCLKAFPSLSELWRVYREKLYSLFIWMEIPNNVSYYMYRQFSPTLAALPAPYYWLAPLGIVGFFWGFWRLRLQFVPYFLMLATSALPLFLSTSVARYRTPFVVLLTLLAAYLIVVFTELLSRKQFKSLAVVAGLLVGAAAFTWNIRDRKFFPFYPNDIVPVYLIHYSERLVKLELAKEYEKYVALLDEFLKYLPEHFYRLTINSRLYQTNEANCCRYIVRFFDMQSYFLKELGRHEEARKHAERAQVLRALVEDFDQRMKKKKNN